MSVSDDASSVAGIGNFLIRRDTIGDRDAPPVTFDGDIAWVNDESSDPSEHRIDILGQSGGTYPVVLTRVGGFAGFTVRSAGNIDGISGDEFIVAGRDVSYVLFGDEIGNRTLDIDALVSSHQARVYAAGNLQPIGDFNGDGLIDFAGIQWADVPALDGMDLVTHPRTAIFFGSSDPRNFDPGNAVAADVVIEPTDPLFAKPLDATVGPGTIAGVADLNGDGRAELIETLGAVMSLYWGEPVVAAPPTPPPPRSGGDERVEAYRFELASVSGVTSFGTPAGIDLVNGPSEPGIEGALSLEGTLAGDELSEFGLIGDVNGDGYDDYLAIGISTAYLIPGPIELREDWSVQEASIATFDLRSLGRVTPSVGDLNADGFNDLAFVRDRFELAGDGGDLADVHVILGRRDMPRSIDVSMADITFGGDAGSTALLMNWNGDEYVDLALIGPFGGTIYDGQALPTGDFVVLNAFTLDDTNRVQLVRSTEGLAAATQVDSFRQFRDDPVELVFPNQYFGLDSITYDPETGHLFAHQFDQDQIREFDLDGNQVNFWADGVNGVDLPHMAEEGAISISTAPMRLADVDLPAYTMLLFLGNLTSGRAIVGENKQLVLAYDKFTGERLAVLETDLPTDFRVAGFFSIEAGVYHPLRQTLFILTSARTVVEVDPVAGTILSSFDAPIGPDRVGGFESAVGDIEYDRITGNLLVTEQWPHLRIFEMSPDGELIQTVDRPEFSRTFVNGSSAAPSIALDPYNGDAYVALGLASFATETQIQKFSGFSKQSSMTAIVAGDTNADGLDDLLITDQTFVRFREGSGRDAIGRTYVVPGRVAQGEISLASDSSLIVQATQMGPRGSALGDLDGDGFDEIAVTRQREGNGELEGSAFVFYGGTESGQVVLDPVADADIVIRRDDVEVLQSGQTVGGPVSVTAGDFDGNGHGDLAIGLPTTARISSSGNVLSEDQRGHGFVYFDVTRNSDLRLTTSQLGDGLPDVTIGGAQGGDQLGTLPSGGPLDLNLDGVQDLVLGAAGTNGAFGPLSPRSGRIHLVHGDYVNSTI